VKVIPPEELEKLGHTHEHQGYLARMQDFPYATLQDLLKEKSDSPSFFVMLDGIQDPYNLGAILRSAEVFGAHGAILQATGQVGVTSMVARSSAGAVNRIPIARVESLEDTAVSLMQRGVALVGASEKAPAELPACDLRRPACIVIGNEGTGMSEGVRSRCSEWVKIPQHGHVGSLNAAVAAGIFFYELRRQRG
jgi:23S rRNA (guanosine2251-2'-O)-methyltransferase